MNHSNMVSIDPGLNECGVALWECGELTSTFLVTSDADPTAPIDSRIAMMAYELSQHIALGDLVVIERMEPRRGRSDAWDDLINLSLISGAVITCADRVKFVRPSRWTGKRSKPINHKRILSRLNTDERQRLDLGLAECPKNNHKEILDAVGIGLYQLDRL